MKPAHSLLLTRSFCLVLVFSSQNAPLFLLAQSEGSPANSPYGLIVSEIRIVGLHHTREEIVRGQLASEVGQPYTEANAMEDRRWLDQLGVFSSIRFTPDVVDNKVLLIVEFQEIPRILPYPSINVTGENGLSAGFGLKAPSFLRRAIPLSLSGQFGPLTKAGLECQSPWRPRQRFWFDFHFDYRDRPNESFHYWENAGELDFKAGTVLGQRWRLGGRFALTRMDSHEPGITLSPDNRDFTPALGAVLQFDGRDLSSNPHRGWQVILGLTQSGGFMGGDGNFVTAQFDLRRYQPLAARHVMALFTYAALQSGTVGVDVPIYRTFTIGGPNTVRGWNQDARQGNNQFLNTLEYRYDLLPPKSFRVHGYGFYLGVQLAAFGDLGTAWNGEEDFTRNMIGGGGFGVRLIIPFVDMIRFDFGFGQSGQGLLRAFGIHEKAYYSSQRVR